MNDDKLRGYRGLIRRDLDELEVRLDTIDNAASYYRIALATSNRTVYGDLHDVTKMFSADANYTTLQVTVLTDMDAGDNAYIFIHQSGGTSQSDVQGQSHFSGFLAH